jgi:hypothetical protein
MPHHGFAPKFDAPPLSLVKVHDENDELVTIPDGSFVMRIEEGKEEQ